LTAEGPTEYRSPKRCLAHSFRLSRDRWKAKATDRLAAIHSLRGRIRDLACSRDLWKRKALYYQDLLRQAGRLPVADLLPADAFAPVPPLAAEAPACAAPAEAPVGPRPAASGDDLKPSPVSAPPPCDPGAEKKRRHRR
jgi:hypothetical protein